MGLWFFWEEYSKALDNFPGGEVQGVVTPSDTSSVGLDREASCSNNEMVSRFLSAIQRMPRAWGSRPWSSYELIRAGNVVANDLFRRKMKKKHGL